MRILLTYFLFLPLVSFSQFSGKITYKESYVSNNEAISIIKFAKFAGDERILFIQDSYLKNVYNGFNKTVTLYRGDVNKLYRFHVGQPEISWMDASRDTLGITYAPTIQESDEIIFGLKCKKLEFKSSAGVTTYYFNEYYSMDPQNFENYHLESWNFYTSIAKAIPLKIVFESKEMNFVSTAIKVESMRLSENIFDVPPGYLKKLF